MPLSPSTVDPRNGAQARGERQAGRQRGELLLDEPELGLERGELGVRPSLEYPSAERRLTEMISGLGLPEAERVFADSWLSDYRRRAAERAAEASNAAAMSKRFEKVMPVEIAYEGIDRIRKDLREAGIVLDQEPVRNQR